MKNKFGKATQDKWIELFEKFPDDPVKRMIEYLDWLERDNSIVRYVTISTVRKLLSNQKQHS